MIHLNVIGWPSICFVVLLWAEIVYAVLCACERNTTWHKRSKEGGM